jgi:two-component sensor histidine kinase
MRERELVGLERIVGWLPASGQPLWIRLVSATLVMALTFALELALARFVGLPGLSFLLIGVFVCAVVFDHGTGFYAGVLAIVGAYYTLLLLRYAISTLPGAIMFSLLCAGVALFGEAVRQALERAVAAERTANLLLRELQHRTQNTLSIIVALLELQIRSTNNAEAKEALQAAANRVRIQSEAHRHLDPQHIEKIDAHDYLTEVCRLIERSLQGVRHIQVECNIQRTPVDAQKALALGLIVNELVTNAIKYAFGEEQKGKVTVTLDRNESGLARLRVRDDGAGCPDTALPGMGTQLIAALVKEHRGTYERANRERGCEVCVVLRPKTA